MDSLIHFKRLYDWRIISSNQVEQSQKTLQAHETILPGVEFKFFLSDLTYRQNLPDHAFVHVQLKEKYAKSYNELLLLLRYLNDQARSDLSEKIEQALQQKESATFVWEQCCKSLTGMGIHEITTFPERYIPGVVTRSDLEKHPFMLNFSAVSDIMVNLYPVKFLIRQNWNFFKHFIGMPLNSEEKARKEAQKEQDLLCERNIHSFPNIRHHLPAKNPKQMLSFRDELNLRKLTDMLRLLPEDTRVSALSTITKIYERDCMPDSNLLSDMLLKEIKKHSFIPLNKSKEASFHHLVNMGISGCMLLNEEELDALFKKILEKETVKERIRRKIISGCVSGKHAFKSFQNHSNNLYQNYQIFSFFTKLNEREAGKVQPIIRVEKQKRLTQSYFKLNNHSRTKED